MDNLAHTLAGAALAEAGLKRRTALGAATLMIGANLPDVDAVLYFVDPLTALAWRRGVTHGVLAMLVLPLVLVGAMLAWARLAERRGKRYADPVRPRQILILAAIGVWLHPALDWLNVYGIRLLSPFSERWFYGDVLWIIDPWLWLTLALGVFLSRRRGRAGRSDAGRPARVAVGLVTAYLALMWAGSLTARRLASAHAPGAAQVVAAPVALDPFRRDLIVETNGLYLTGAAVLGPGGSAELDGPRIPIRSATPEARTAAASPRGRAFLSWSRLPYFEPVPGGVRIGDARYPGPESWAQVVVRER
jgi:inner membrane protein